MTCAGSNRQHHYIRYQFVAIGLTVVSVIGEGSWTTTRVMAHDDGRHSLVKNSAQSTPSRMAPLKGSSPAGKAKRAVQLKRDKKGHRLIKKPQAQPLPADSLPASNPQGGSQPIAKQDSPTENPAQTEIITSGVGTAAMTTAAPGMAAKPGAPVGSAGAATVAAAAPAGTAPASGRAMQSIIQQVPALITLLGRPPAVFQDPVAPLPPPLVPPPSGLPAAPPNWFAYHVLNRLTYGGTPNQLNWVATLKTTVEAQEWATAFMKEQLELDPAKPWPTTLTLHSTSPLPAAIPIQDVAVDQLLVQDKTDWRADSSDPAVLSPSFSELQDHDLIRKMHSRRQLREKMVYFWDNHFNTNYRAHGKGQYELQENEMFRRLAFAAFRDLLVASGKSAAMMLYLNTDVNVKEHPNENYAREVLELHTLGVTAQGTPNGYSQADIVEAAKAFTGWDNTADVRGGFRFVASRHSPGSKVVLGQTVPFNGTMPTEGEQVLFLAARHPSTARHIAKKLCEYFVSDVPSSALVDEVTSVFADSGGDIRKMLIAIFTSADFSNVANYRGQVKTPLEYLVSLYRNLGVWSSRDPFRSRLIAMGQSLYECPPPTGFKEGSMEWLNTNVLFHAFSMAYEMTISGYGYTIRYGSPGSGGQIREWMAEMGLETEADILGLLTNLTTDRVVTAMEYQIYLDTLRAGLSGKAFSLKDTSREYALDRTVATMLTNPRYLYQ